MCYSIAFRQFYMVLDPLVPDEIRLKYLYISLSPLKENKIDWNGMEINCFSLGRAWPAKQNQTLFLFLSCAAERESNPSINASEGVWLIGFALFLLLFLFVGYERRAPSPQKDSSIDFIIHSINLTSFFGLSLRMKEKERGEWDWIYLIKEERKRKEELNWVEGATNHNPLPRIMKFFEFQWSGPSTIQSIPFSFQSFIPFIH